MKIVVTGCAGFIGSHVSEKLLKMGHHVFGIDNMNNYYSISIKEYNLNLLKSYSNFEFFREDILDTKIINNVQPDWVCHLASMAGVRHSIRNPSIYIDINIRGFINILNQCVDESVKNLVYASSSSVYGLSKTPFREDQNIDRCNSPYACSKLAMEIFAKSYYQIHGLQNIGLRFFTVYGPRGRPDMAPYKFLHAIKSGIKFQKYGDGSSSRDYTYIDDIVSGVVAALENKKNIQCDIYNLGNSNPVSLNQFISLCEEVVGKKAIYEVLPMPKGDVPHTFADISHSKNDLDYAPKISLKDGLQKTFISLV